MNFFFLFFALGLFSFLSASVGSVIECEGNFKIKKEGSIKKIKALKGMSLEAGDLLTTTSNARAILELVDGSNVILDEKSTLHFASATNATQTEGKIFYKVSTKNAKNALKIETPFAIIGIKGTTFIIDATKKRSSLRLQEGLVSVVSIEEEFELYKKEIQKEFRDYIERENDAFEQFKNAQDAYKFVKKSKSIELTQQHQLSFLGQRVNEEPLNISDNEEFKDFEMLLKSSK